ncbi:thiolase family protein [Sneathiella sp. P13V-1]|uniref:thiolase family protein n=1 Tax=Sneathiella sp. P13V-1 TaxID=2697366 RepID=UPI00187B78B3|nr:thiolase family protein [Sneathiella sp. P13V-1]MBE7638379.1 thiolase family protein [Sneathiella sp. P13V-1]
MIKNNVVIAGVGESDIGKVPELSGLGLNAQAAKRAVEDAGLEMKDIDGLLTAYSMTEPYFMMGSVLAEYLGIKPTFCASLTVGGGTPGAALHHAAMAIASGQAKTVLITAGENRATGQSRDDAVKALTQVGHPYFENPYGPLIPSFYAMIANRYMHEYGTTREQMAAVAVRARDHAIRHPSSPQSKHLTIDDVLSSKPISTPLNILDCCLISDAAGALVVTSADRAKDLKGKPAYLHGIGESHTHEHMTMAPSLTEFGTEISGKAAYEMSGLSPSDIDFAELYDCFSIVPIIEAEELGLAKRGEGGALYASGETAIEGSIPINTHGGLLSYAQAGASGGMHGIVEAVRQLRGNEGARQVKKHDIALVHNEGGILSSHCTMILGQHPL